jgi:hypothetical protein
VLPATWKTLGKNHETLSQKQLKNKRAGNVIRYLPNNCKTLSSNPVIKKKKKKPKLESSEMTNDAPQGLRKLRTSQS